MLKHTPTTLRFLLLLLLAACTALTPLPTPTATVLVGTRWKLVSLQGRPPLAGTTITLAFASGILRTLSGSDGCNEYNGPYPATVDGGLTITQTERTVIGCLNPPGIGAQADAYMGALHQAAAYRLTDGELTIIDKTGAVLLVFAKDS